MAKIKLVPNHVEVLVGERVAGNWKKVSKTIQERYGGRMLSHVQHLSDIIFNSSLIIKVTCSALDSVCNPRISGRCKTCQRNPYAPFIKDSIAGRVDYNLHNFLMLSLYGLSPGEHDSKALVEVVKGGQRRFKQICGKYAIREIPFSAKIEMLEEPARTCFKTNFYPDFIERAASEVQEDADKLNEKYKGLLDLPRCDGAYYKISELVRKLSLRVGYGV